MSLSTDKMKSNLHSSRCSFLNDNIAMTLDFLQVQRTSRGWRWTNQIRGSAWLREWGVAAVRMMEEAADMGIGHRRPSKIAHELWRGGLRGRRPKGHDWFIPGVIGIFSLQLRSKSGRAYVQKSQDTFGFISCECGALLACLHRLPACTPDVPRIKWSTPSLLYAAK